MCQETCRKIQSAVVPTPQPATIQFLKATAGYSMDDYSVPFSKSQARVQFLGLASALVTTTGPFVSGITLHGMVMHSAADRTLLPTGRQLKDRQAGNTDVSCQDCKQCLRLGELLCSSIFSACRMHLLATMEELCQPSTCAVGDLTGTFRQLSRLGDSTVERATIRTTDSLPWIAAFTK